MPVLAYFWKVGAALLALLFVADLCLRKTEVAEQAAADRPAIRIHSDRKWPERVILDTSLPASLAAPPEIARADAASSPGRTEPPVIRADTPAVANAMARTDQPPHEAVDRKRPRKTPHVATRSKRHATPQMMLAARQGQYAWFGYGYRYW
ncbi:hypothetical protein JQ625_22210 [Bradyrhizobium diazoefficiens]|nr:hypothetical protein [Bradyrhizobium diazoefficiens]MBR0777557.1 hypothetical protein [Bradyrhizobium diazoefficiens]